MRLAALAFALLAGCVTVAPPNERVEGCWISRGTASTATMRWLPDPDQPDRFAGVLTTYGEAGAVSATAYALRQEAADWSFCQTDGEGQRCWVVAQGRSGSLQGGRAFIDASGERLRIAVVSEAGAERIIFNGRRDGCD